MLLAAEGVDLEFTDGAVEEVARLAEELNTQLENIGARRLHTVMERLVEDISFDAPDRVAEAAEAAEAGAPPPEAAPGAPPLPDAAAGAAPGGPPGGAAGGPRYRYVIDAAAVRDKVGALLKRQDLSKYIL
ncbi:hypothetical protein Rsub_01663 [Raphidocelis subcapitata]|uniref:Clp ATPase C-terminal domain-containing protein n=1 Tax=Raphidocelis subcapitata TaxID=307507 RepID=A0A2V0NQ95_9CHLO|nr:hypothetical protein Rsub_01663 [Raphidocelis subcapitata]|eukprot:GBF88762.1 hypothetical protein Rsub_01663 [Raphidocelis subcapitata]